jgi:hypothetical protein
MLCKGFLAAAGTKTPGQKIWFYSIRVPKLCILRLRQENILCSLNLVLPFNQRRISSGAGC